MASGANASDAEPATVVSGLTPSKLKIPQPFPSKWGEGVPSIGFAEMPGNSEDSRDVEQVPGPSPSSSSMTGRAKLSAHKGTMRSQQKWVEQQQQQKLVASQRRELRSSAGSLNMSSTGSETGVKAKFETPVPLPNTVQHIIKAVKGAVTGTRPSTESSLPTSTSRSPSPGAFMDVNPGALRNNDGVEIHLLDDDSSTDSDDEILEIVSRSRSKEAPEPEPRYPLDMDGRSYGDYIASDGKLTSTNALFPEGYELHPDPEFPVICPVRTCQRIFPKFVSLTGHLYAAHVGKTLNDNRDGTFSVVGKYYGTKCIVVSRKRLIDAPPPAPPQLSAAAAMKIRAAESKARRIYRRSSSVMGANTDYVPPDNQDPSPTAPTANLSRLGPNGGHQTSPTRKRRRVESSEESHGSLVDHTVVHNSSGHETSNDSVAAIGPNAAQPGGSDIEMEEWEIAPGRVVDHKLRQNEAYSAPFLATGIPIMIMPDIFVNVQTIRPGQLIRIEADRDQCKVCSIARGKVKVTHAKSSWSIGVNGAFPMRPKEAYTVQNKMYSDAVLHFTTVKNYEFRNDDL